MLGTERAIVLILFWSQLPYFAFVADAATQPSNCSDGDLRLVGGEEINQGRLQVCMNGAWGSVCDSGGVFTTDEAVVACRQLGLLQGEGHVLSMFIVV